MRSLVPLALAVAGCTTYASVARTNAPGIVDISTPVPREDGSDTRYTVPDQPGTDSTVVWLHPAFGAGVGRNKGISGELSLDVSIERDHDTRADGVAPAAWGVTAGASIFQIYDRAPDDVGVMAPGALSLEVYRRRLFGFALGGGALVYPDTGDVGAQVTFRFPLGHLRARYVADSGFEAMFAFDLHFPFVFARSR